jgi:hypothetical protein
MNFHYDLKKGIKRLFSDLFYFIRKEKYFKSIDPPESYYIGQEFIEDREQITATILCSFHLSALIKPISFTHKESKIITAQNGSDLILSIERNISKRLFYTASKDRVSIRFIVGYINEILPTLNEHLLEQKYLCGHLLIRTFSPLDIHKLFIINSNKKRKHFQLMWPPMYSNFPKSNEYAKESNYKFIRDLIEATTSYFYNNFDDCIRKIITSIENYFKLRNIQDKTFSKKLLKSLKSEYHIINWQSYLPMFFSNIMFVYKIRNSIVHDKYRMDFSDSWLCMKGIGTLFYIYQSNLNDKNTLRYNFSLMQQFVALDNECKGLLLYNYNNSTNDSRVIANTAAEMDKAIFSSLEISQEEIEKIETKLNRYNN